MSPPKARHGMTSGSGCGFVLVLAAVALSPSMMMMMTDVQQAAFADHPTTEIQIVGYDNKECQAAGECFAPSEVTVNVGGEVVWMTQDGDATSGHYIVSGDLDADPGKVGVDLENGFSSELFTPGNTFTHKFEAEGSYPYFCQVHPWMVGVVHVEGTHDDGDDGMMTHPESVDEVMATIMAGEAMQGSPLSIDVDVTDTDGGMLEHVNFKVVAMQNGQVIHESVEHAHDGKASLMTGPLEMAASDEMPIDITVELVGFGVDEITGPAGMLPQSTQVVPEFGTIAVMILAVAVVSIIAVTARSGLVWGSSGMTGGRS